MSENKLIIIDGNSLANRAFYALPPLSNKEGVVTNAVYGFTNMLNRLFKDENPGYFAVTFDKKGKVFRHKKFPDYKGHRKGMPDDLSSQMPLMKEVLEAMNVPYYEKDGFEADDLIGTMVKWAEDEGLEPLIVTGDRDSLQLVSEKTKVMLTKRGITETELNDLEFIKEKYNLSPKQIIDLKGFMGDSADNIPGVPGIGKKTALKLLHKYGDMETVYENLEDFSGKKMGENLLNFKEQAFMSRELATIYCDVEMELKKVEMKVKKPKKEKLLALYQDLEFKNLYKELLADVGENIAKVLVNKEGKRLETIDELNQVIQDDMDEFSFLLVREKEVLKGLAFNFNKKSFYYEFKADENIVFAALRDIFENESIEKTTYDVKNAQITLNRANVNLNGLGWDVLLAAYLLDPSEKDLEIGSLLTRYLNIGISEHEENYLFIYVSQLKKLLEGLLAKLEEDGLLDLYLELELPLSRVLAKMEIQGVKLDVKHLEKMEKELDKRLNKLTEEIYAYSGEEEEFNINSPKQLGIVLFEKMGLPVIKKTKTGYSTSAEVLEKLQGKNPIIDCILDYRQYMKLKSTYVDGFLKIRDLETDKVHTSFNQTITETGRLSSTEPNLQNIPVRLEEGREIRKAFIPSKEGFIFVAADYSQIELRVLAHMANDQNLIEAFNEGQDIHAKTAAEVLGANLDDVSPEERRHAKAINFGIIYGLSDFGLAKDLNISRKEAKQYIDNYFLKYSGVKNWIDETIFFARENGYVETLLGRRRYLRDILNRNFNIRKFAERTAMNTPIQGSAADIIKLAMLKIDKKFQEKGLTSKMILQVHDELVFEVAPNESAQVVQIVKKAMEEAYPLDVPLTVDLEAGFNWSELESI